MSIRVGVLLRHEDASGVSGVGIKAHIIEFPNGAIVGRWISDTPSFFYFDCLKGAELIHGHGGKTEIVFYDEIQPPGTPEDLEKMLRTPSEEEITQEMVERISQEVAEQVTENMKDQVARRAARTAVKRMAAALTEKENS